MKKLLSILLSLCLVFSVIAVMASCDNGSVEEKTTQKEETTTENKFDGVTDGESVENTTEETSAEETESESESESESVTDEATTAEEVSTEELEGMYYDEENKIYHIYDAEGLYAFGAMVNDLYYNATDVYYLEECTISIDADIDCKDMPSWEPMVVCDWYDVVFEGNNHTIKNLKIDGVDAADAQDYGIAGQKTNMDNAFIGLLYSSVVTIQNLKFEGCVVTCYGQQNAIIVGWVAQSGEVTDLTISNCEVYDCKVLGYMPYGEGAEHAIGFRCAAFIGANFGGYVTLTKCRAESIVLTGFHNLAAFVGFDGVDCVYLEDCTATDIDITFSYTVASYTATNKEMNPEGSTYNKVFVDPFFCKAQWDDHLADELANGNSYTLVVYHDYEDPNAPEYDPENFRSGVYNYDYQYIGKAD